MEVLNGTSYMTLTMYHQGCMLRFWKGKGTKAIFSLARAPYEEIVNFYWSISWASRQWQGATEAIAKIIKFCDNDSCATVTLTIQLCFWVSFKVFNTFEKNSQTKVRFLLVLVLVLVLMNKCNAPVVQLGCLKVARALQLLNWSYART